MYTTKKHIFLFLVVLQLVFTSSCSGNLSFSESNAEDFYNEHEESFGIIATYLSGSSYTSISIRDASGKMEVYDTYRSMYVELEIKEQEVLEAISNLMNSDCISINKNNDTIECELFHRLNNYCNGIAYSKNTTSDIDIQYLTKLVPLSSAGWYYYEVNVDLWEVNNK